MLRTNFNLRDACGKHPTFQPYFVYTNPPIVSMGQTYDQDKKNDTRAFILIRTKLNLWNLRRNKVELSYFQECLESALRQTYPNTSIIILKYGLFALPLFTTKYWWCPRVVRKIVNRHKTNTNITVPEVYVYHHNNRGAALSLYNIHRILIDKIGKIEVNDNDIAILLDDDDMLVNSSVVQDIVDRMDKKNASICLTQFESIGESSLNIVNQAGRIHNNLIKELNEQGGDVTPCSSTESFGESALCFADSLGWTKAYRIKVIKKYHEDLLSIFKRECKLKCFLRNNDAFEDFPEIINLCRKDVKTTVLATPTHKYRKHPNSITATPREKDFKCKRTAYLTLLMKLYNELTGKNEGKNKDKNILRKDSDKTIARYFTIKILTIENILAKFRTNGINQEPNNCGFWGWLVKSVKDIWNYKNNKWLRESKQGSFVEWLIESLNRERVLSPFLELLNNNTTPSELPKEVVKRVCKKEAEQGIVDMCHCFGDKSTRFQTDRIKTIKRQLWIYRGIIAITFTIIGLIIYLWIFSKADEKGGFLDFGAFAAIATAICGWATTNIHRIKTERAQEDTITDMFGNAVDDLIRHIVAGYMVLYKIQQDMLPLSTHPKKPAKVHFSNLKVSQQSLLMSDKFDNNLVVQEFKNLPRLRVNIRNINNSAEYMERYLDDSAYDSTHMYNIIEWEMNRYMGYFVNFMFFKENNMFRFPDETEREIFLKTHQLYNHFAKIACSNHPDYPKLIRNLKLEERYEAYKEDRGDNRKVLIF